jgi:hypothetical protein
MLNRLSSQKDFSIEEYEKQLASLYDVSKDNKLNTEILNKNKVDFLKPTEKNPQGEKIDVSNLFSGSV